MRLCREGAVRYRDGSARHTGNGRLRPIWSKAPDRRGCRRQGREAVLHGGSPVREPGRRQFCASARAYRVLDAGRRRPAEGALRRVPAHRDARHRDDRSRQRVRRLRLLVEGQQGRGQADHRHRGVRGPREPRAQEAGQVGRPEPEGRRHFGCRRLHPHDAARGDDRGHAQHFPALLAGVPGGVLPQAADGPRTARQVLQRDHRDHRLPQASTTRPSGPRPTTGTSSGRATSSSRSWTTGWAWSSAPGKA